MVRSRVVDIASDRPQPDDVFWVDSNVWIGIVYTRARSTQWPPYERYMRLAAKAGSKLFVGPVNFAEVAKHIEVGECIVWSTRNNRTYDASQLKRFRREPAERENVIEEIETAWNQMLAIAQLATSSLEATCISTAIAGMKSGDLLDGGDMVQVAECRRNEVQFMITDDADFVTVDGLVVVTASRKAMNAASAVGLFGRS